MKPDKWKILQIPCLMTEISIYSTKTGQRKVSGVESFAHILDLVHFRWVHCQLNYLSKPVHKKIVSICIPDPQTTNKNKANNQGPTGYFSSDGFWNKQNYCKYQYYESGIEEQILCILSSTEVGVECKLLKMLY